MKRNIIVKGRAACVSIVIAAVFLSGCTAPWGGNAEAEATVSEDEGKIEVNVSKPEIKSITISSNFAGTIVAESEVKVMPLVSGEVTEKNFEVGDHVNEGDLLFKIDDEALQIAVSQAEATLTTARAGLSTTQANAEATRAQANATRASATKSVGEIPYNEESMNVAVDSSYVNKRAANNSLKNAEDTVAQNERNLKDYKDARDAAKSARDTAEREMNETDPASPEYESKKAAYESAKSVYETAKTRVENAENQLDSSKRSADNAEMQYELSKENYNLSQMQRNNYNTYTVPTTLYGAYASAVGADASDVSAANSITSSAASVKQAQAGLDSAKLNLEHATVTSPVSGTITAINVSLHNMANMQTVAYTIQSDEPCKVVFYVAEETVHNIIPGSDTLINKNGRDYPAKILNVYDTIDPDTGLFKIEAVVNSGVKADELIAGSSVTIRTVTRRSDNVLTVPINAVYYDGDQPFAYINDNGVAKRVDVVTGLSDDESVEITEGLTADMQVLVTWSGSLRDGAPLKAEEVQPAAKGEAKTSAGAGTEE
ncbi:MAG: efflux RND transporter periplasmic adaptor subunit [Lachnospiraceae bacterium]|nr:efflux RND transporter periplasmic adaptor subunit [Lachnospiraceae bacterium]